VQLFTLQILCNDSFRGEHFKEEKEALDSPMALKMKLKQLEKFPYNLIMASYFIFIMFSMYPF
jgi:hypothetical protein